MVEGRLRLLLRRQLRLLTRSASMDGLSWHLLRVRLALWLHLALSVGMLRLLHHHTGPMRLLGRLRKGSMAWGRRGGRHG